MTKQERSWVLYDWANSAYSIIITTAIFPIFFKGVAAAGAEGYVSTSMWGYANSLYTLILAVLAPVLGTIADYEGRKKRFFIVFFIIGVLCTLGLALVARGEWIKALIIYIGSAIGFSGANIFYDAFLTDVTAEDRMDWVSTSGYGWGYIGSTVPFVLCLLMILNHKALGFETSVPAVRISFLVTGLWWLAFTVPLLRNVKQIYFIPSSAFPVRDSFRRIGETIKGIRQYRNLAVFLAAYFFYIDGVDTIIKMATPIAIDVGINENSLLVILLAIQIVAFPFALLYGKLAKKFTARTMLFAGIGIYFVITFIAFFLPSLPSIEMKTTLFWVLSMLVATSQGGIQALSRSLYGKLVPKERSAEFFGFYNIFGKFAAIMGPFLVAFFASLTRNTAYGILSINILFLIGGILLFFVRQKEI
jgi:UMF1 family MFS transporter